MIGLRCPHCGRQFLLSRESMDAQLESDDAADDGLRIQRGPGGLDCDGDPEAITCPACFHPVPVDKPSAVLGTSDDMDPGDLVA